MKYLQIIVLCEGESDAIYLDMIFKMLKEKNPDINFKFTSIPIKTKNATEEFLKLAGSWEDARNTEEIIDDMRAARVNSTRFEVLDGIFD